MSYPVDADIVCKYELLFNKYCIEIYKEVVEDLNNNRFAINYYVLTPNRIFKCNDEVALMRVVVAILLADEVKKLMPFN